MAVVLRTIVGAIAALTVASGLRGAEPYRWQLPPGFPTPKVPADNPMSNAKVALGCRLFFDTRLSVNNRIACATCHRPELAFSDGRKVSVGATGESTSRNAMSLTNVAYNAAYTWGSHALTLEEQMYRPLFGDQPVEMGLTLDDRAVIELLLQDSNYVDAFRAAFPDDASPAMTDVIKAIASYQRTLIFGRSAFDRYVFDDQRSALTESAKRGMALFSSSRVDCVRCHFGINFAGPIVHERSPTEIQPLFARTGVTVGGADDGLAKESKRAEDVGRFRVPTLRNVALTAPYMHDGSLATLDDVLDHYTTAHAIKGSDLRPLSLSREDREDLIAVLGALSDTRSAGATCAPGIR